MHKYISFALTEKYRSDVNSKTRAAFKQLKYKTLQ